jgi:hypothetical protein
VDNPVWLFVRQRPEQDRVDDAEDGRVGADPQGQGDNRHQRKAGILAELTQAVSDIVPNAAHGVSPVHLTSHSRSRASRIEGCERR